jgi:pimeloyl-ACP methyl ester carboxylesterase
VLCTEDAPRIARALAAPRPGDRPPAPPPLGLPIAAELAAACAGWPVAPLAPGDTLPVHSGTPVLFLSGALDPVAPPEWADAAAEYLPNAVHLVDPGGGHAPGDDCARQAVARFVDGGPDAVRQLACARARAAVRQAAGPLEVRRARP